MMIAHVHNAYNVRHQYLSETWQHIQISLIQGGLNKGTSHKVVGRMWGQCNILGLGTVALFASRLE